MSYVICFYVEGPLKIIHLAKALKGDFCLFKSEGLFHVRTKNVPVVEAHS